MFRNEWYKQRGKRKITSIGASPRTRFSKKKSKSTKKKYKGQGR